METVGEVPFVRTNRSDMGVHWVGFVDFDFEHRVRIWRPEQQRRLSPQD